VQPGSVKLRLLIDQNVAQAVAEVFTSRGHDVQFSRDVLQQNSPDPLIAIAAAMEGLIVITHDSDFRRYRALFPQGFRTQARRMTGRIVLAVDEARASKRVSEVIEVIEFHFAYATSRGIRLMVSISETGINVIDNAPKP
jgi:hypothetical protein